MKNLSAIHACFLDMDGTIYNGSTLFPTTKPFLEFLDSRMIPYVFLTNNSSYSHAEYRSKLEKMGIACTEMNFYTSADFMIDFLKSVHPEFKKLFILGMDSIKREFEEASFEIVESDDDVDCVVVAFDRTLDYEKLCKAAWYISKDVPAFATHPDNFCPTDGKTFLVDCGAITRCLETATSKKITVLGKPLAGMLVNASKRLGLTSDECLMVGDRLATDIACGKNANSATCLISDSETSSDEADYNVRNLGELEKIWRKAILQKNI